MNIRFTVSISRYQQKGVTHILDIRDGCKKVKPSVFWLVGVRNGIHNTGERGIEGSWLFGTMFPNSQLPSMPRAPGL